MITKKKWFKKLQSKINRILSKTYYGKDSIVPIQQSVSDDDMFVFEIYNCFTPYQGYEEIVIRYRNVDDVAEAVMYKKYDGEHFKAINK